MNYEPQLKGNNYQFQARLIDTYFNNFESYLEECKSHMVDVIKLARAVHKLKSALAYLANKDFVQQLSTWESDLENNKLQPNEEWYNDFEQHIRTFNDHLKIYREKI